MDAQLKQKWLEALRSGKYEQGSGVLRTETNRFCCLGVLCDVVDPTGWLDVELVDTSIKGLELEIDAYPYKHGSDVSETTLPDELKAQLRLAQADISALIEMNDSGRSFREIARHIEANIPAEAQS